MPLGDSITWGIVNNDTGNEESGGYRTVLYDALLRNGFPNDPNTGFDFIGELDNTDPRISGPATIDNDHEGYRGFRIDEIEALITAGTVNVAPADVILLMAGTNDAIEDATPVVALNRLTALINTILAVPGFAGQVLVASIPPLNPASPRIDPQDAANVPLFNAGIPDVVNGFATNVTFVDIAAQFANLPVGQVITPDGIHPTSETYTQIADAWYNALLPILDPDISPDVGAPRELSVEPIRVEAENIAAQGGDLGDFTVDNRVFNDITTAPRPQVISLADRFDATNGTDLEGTATLPVNAPTGSYDLVIGYYDEGGTGNLQVGFAGDPNLLANFPLNQGAGAGPSDLNFVRRTVGQGVFIDANNPPTLEITGTIGLNDGGEAVRIDYIEYIPLNDAPILPATAAPLLTPLEFNPEPATNTGDLVSTLVTDSGVSEIDLNPQFGIAVTGVDETNGIWQFSTDGGATWQSFSNPGPAPSPVSARLLAADDLTRVRFLPNPGYSGDATLTFRAWDRTRGVAGDIVNPQAVGGTTAFSELEGTATVTVNTLPVAEDDTAVTEQNIALNIDVLDNDTDADGDPLTLSIVTDAGSGTATVNTNGTPDPTDDLITYTPNPDFTGTDQFTYQVDDGNGGTDTATVSVTVNPTDGTPPPGAVSLVRDTNNFFTIAGDAGEVQLLFTPVGREADFANEVGVFLVAADGSVNGIAPGSPDYTQAALAQGQVIFSSVPDAASSTRQLQFDTGDRLMFYLVSDGTTDEVLAGQESDVFFAAPVLNSDGFNYLEVSDLANSTFTLRWEDEEGGGDEDFNDFEFNVQLSNLPAPIGAQLQGGQQQELVDLRDQTDAVQATFSVSSEAAYDNFVGFYAIADVDGSIDANQDGLVDFRPGDAGYAQAAIQQRVVSFNSDGIAPVQLNNLLLAPFIIADGTPEEFLAENPTNQGDDTLLAYFAFLGANPDGSDHVRLLGDNRFGFEDQFGGGDSDFNDITFQVEFA
jgi:lysophospholipase L1-like esterase